MIGVIGAGSVGVNIAILLANMGHNVTLIEKNSDILLGASLTSFINHGDGFEYYKPGHQITGRHCIDGSMIKSLLFPKTDFSTGVVGEGNPIRFLVSDKAHSYGLTPLKRFYQNAYEMSIHFENQFESIVNRNFFNSHELGSILKRSPKNFYSILNKEDYSDIPNIAGGCAGSSYGVSMAKYYSFMKSLLKRNNVKIHFNSEPKKIEKKNDGLIEVQLDNFSLNFDYLFVCTSHNIPYIEDQILKENCLNKVSGTYFLNCMTIVKLPKTKSQLKINTLSKINFTLQGEYGCMFACIKSPTKTEDGYGAIYYPSVAGSQFLSNIYDKRFSINNPRKWDGFIRDGMNNSEERVISIWNMAKKSYPELKNYAEIVKTYIRPVFNLDTKDSRSGSDRRVRQIGSTPMMENSSGDISFWSAPKWTNCELVALNAIDHFLGKTGRKEFKKNSNGGFGPKKLDIECIFNFKFEPFVADQQSQLDYLTHQGIIE